jgi:hypothetical protein
MYPMNRANVNTSSLSQRIQEAQIGGGMPLKALSNHFLEVHICSELMISHLTTSGCWKHKHHLELHSNILPY